MLYSITMFSLDLPPCAQAFHTVVDGCGLLFVVNVYFRCCGTDVTAEWGLWIRSAWGRGNQNSCACVFIHIHLIIALPITILRTINQTPVKLPRVQCLFLSLFLSLLTMWMSAQRRHVVKFHTCSVTLEKRGWWRSGIRENKSDVSL